VALTICKIDYAVIDKKGFEPDGWTIHTEQDFNLFFAVVLR
jgi:hypothetical protein